MLNAKLVAMWLGGFIPFIAMALATGFDSGSDVAGALAVAFAAQALVVAVVRPRKA